MSKDLKQFWNPNSNTKGQKLGKTLTEKIRDLGFEFPKRRASSWVSMQYVDVKFEENLVTDYVIMVPNINLEQIIYFQPEISYDEENPGRHVYRIGKFQTDYKGPKEMTRISDIKVVSYKPTKTMKFRKKKRHSSIISKIEEILNKHKGPQPSRDPSEESIILHHSLQERQKDINDLPESILQKIFTYFNLKERNTLLSRVCKWVPQTKQNTVRLREHLKRKCRCRSWYYILQDPMFWTALEIQGENVPKETVIGLITRYPGLKKLKLTSVPDVIEILQELCRCNHSITHIGVRHCSLSSHDFERIILHVISCCTNLEVLDIKGMRFQSDSFYLELGRLRKLRSINLSGNKLLRSQNLITLSLNCRHLQELKVQDISPDHGQGFPLKDEDFTFIISQLQPNLETLKVDMQQLRSLSYQAILKCAKLTCLSMKNCFHLNTEIFRQFPNFKNLKKLKVTRAINIKPDDFQFVFGSENMNKIEVLDINGCWAVGEVGLQAITRSLTSLKNLSLKNCKSIKGPHLVHLSQCPKLTYLNLAHTDVQFNHLPTLYQHTKALKSLVIDQKMYKKSTVRQLKNFFPSLNLIMSYSEFEKDERPLINSPIVHLL